jgi:hypothetical protein
MSEQGREEEKMYLGVREPLGWVGHKRKRKTNLLFLY